MAGDNHFFDDMARMASNATGSLFDMKREIEAMVASQMERVMAKMNMVTREEFDAARDIARKAREENEALKERLDALEASLSDMIPANKATAAKAKASKKAKD